YNPAINYRAVEIKSGCFERAAEDPMAPHASLFGKVLLMAEDLMEPFLRRVYPGFEWGDELDHVMLDGSQLAGPIARHPMHRLGGQGSVINAKFNAPDGPICSDLRDTGALLAASADFKHSYPHSWRSKAKVIYRCTPQWFIAMDKAISPSPLAGEGAERSEAG